MKNKNIKIHFIGIGGIGMSGIAELMHKIGYTVCGSDIIESENTKRLREIGIIVKTETITDKILKVFTKSKNFSNWRIENKTPTNAGHPLFASGQFFGSSPEFFISIAYPK